MENKKMTLLQAIECIVELSERSKMSQEIFNEAKKELKFLAKSFGITETQVVLFCICMEDGPNDVDYNDIARYLGIRKISALKYADDINTLVQHRLLRFRNKDEDSFDIPVAVIHSLKHNEVYQIPDHKGLDCSSMFDLLELWFNDLDNESISSNELCEEIESIYKDNPQIGFVKQLKEYQLNPADQMITTFFCHKLVNEDCDTISISSFGGDIRMLYSDRLAYKRVSELFIKGKHTLQDKKIVDFCCEDGHARVYNFKLTEDAKRLLLSEVKFNQAVEKLSADMLDSSKLVEKQLFFSKEVEQKVDELGELLQADNYQKIQDRMKSKGFRNGFACLFYGSPGTGKTETVYQLARKTGRNIMVVDVPNLKSKWVGDSEKNVKAIFDRYRKQVEQTKTTPILLFNEADAIIGKRMSGAEHAVDKMENSIQNIILQEMETLNGIMIATTNLQENLDKAFERRFLYKIKFDKPTEEARANIWRSMIPELDESDIQVLASTYDFSGGQIENIARHYAIDNILHGECDEILSMLIRHCNSERLEEKNSQKIGFL